MKNLLALAAALSLVACGASHSSSTADPSGNTPDTSCQVVLRYAWIQTNGGQMVSSCNQGSDGPPPCWAVVNVSIDVAMDQVVTSAGEAEVYVAYQNAQGDWVQQQATPMAGAGEGYLNFQTALTTNTVDTTNLPASFQLIPFIQVAGGALYDHNVNASGSANYVLNPANSWNIQTSACAAGTPTATATYVFGGPEQPGSGVTNTPPSVSGSLQQGGKIDLSYQWNRVPTNVVNCSQDGENAYALVASVQFSPSGQTLQEVVAGGPYSALVAYPAEFDVPADATSAAIWFEGSNDCGTTVYDSNGGSNFVFSVCPASGC